MTRPGGCTLVTGADGYLGRRIAARLLAETDDRLVLTVRAAGLGELAGKRASLLAGLAEPAGVADPSAGRVQVVAADLRDEEPFGAVPTGGVTCVVHAAARTAFTVDRQTALQVNVRGAAAAAEFARSCPKLERLLVLSTLYSAGRRVGAVPEAAHQEIGETGRGFVNHYEWSKAEAERHLLTTCADLPLTVARLATVVADDDTGAVTQHNAFHNTLKLFFYGLLSLMPGDPATPLYLATADFTAAGLTRLARPGTPGGVYHVAPGPAEVPAVGDLVRVAFDVFEADPGFRRRRLLRPGFCDLASFHELVAASRSLSVSPAGQALGSVAPFAEQLFLPKDFGNDRLRSAWPGYAAPDPRRLVEATCTHLVRTRWGRAGSGSPAVTARETTA
jgi:nucleoside-diphosphate-sugar epimerase